MYGGKRGIFCLLISNGLSCSLNFKLFFKVNGFIYKSNYVCVSIWFWKLLNLIISKFYVTSLGWFWVYLSNENK